MNKYKYDTVCVELVKRFEGLYLHTYRCSSDILTIGYGHTGTDVVTGQTITPERANVLLINDLNETLNYVNYYTTKYGFNNLNQNQINALVSFTFNVGCGNLNKMLQQCKTVNDISVKMQNYNKNAYGVVLSGLVKRRKTETELFIKGCDLMLKTIRKGDKGINVKILQAILNFVTNSKLEIDGQFGEKTLNVVKQYQLKSKLINDGIVGRLTWNSLLCDCKLM